MLKIVASAGIMLLFAVVGFGVLFISPSVDFRPAVVEITRGTTALQAAGQLTQKDQLLFSRLLTIPFRIDDAQITAGTYRFSTAESPQEIKNRLETGDFRMLQNQVVIPEGFTREDIADRLEANLSDTFDRAAFLEISADAEGYLFPDTYELPQDSTAEEVYNLMRENFDQKVADLQPSITNFSRDLSAVIKMASLIEKEAADYRMRRRIAGVLWQRLENDMPLQADAVFDYFLGKNTYELTTEDLAVDSPYNLYTKTGLPPTPIANPGLEAIQATLNPIESEYVYYLTGDNGNFYFAETLPEHQANREAYLE